MPKKVITLNLPEFAFVEGSGHESGGDPLEGRNVILHIRTASVMEVFVRDDVVLNDAVLSFNFCNTVATGIREPMLIALHYSATLDKEEDRDYLLEQVLKPAARWYCDYCDWLDGIILEGM